MTEMPIPYMPCYQTVVESIDLIPEAEQAAAYKALTHYFFYGEQPTNIPVSAEIIFNLAKPSLDSAKKNYENKVKAANARWGKENGKKKKPSA